MRKITFIIAFFISAITMAQNNGLNPEFQVKVYDLDYRLSEEKEKGEESVSDIIHSVAEAINGTVKNTDHKDMIPAINTMVRSALNYVRRFNCVDELVDGENNLDVTGEITNLYTNERCEVHETKNSKGKIIRTTEMKYEGKVSVSLTFTDLRTTQSYTKVFSGTGSSYGDMSSAKGALNGAIRNIKSWIISYYNQIYPIHANLLEVEEVKKDKVKKIYLDVGSAIGVYEGLHFNIFTIDEVAGRTIRKKLGRLKVEEVSGGDICLCKVQRGSKELKEAIDAKKKLRMTSYE